MYTEAKFSSLASELHRVRGFIDRQRLVSVNYHGLLFPQMALLKRFKASIIHTSVPA